MIEVMLDLETLATTPDAAVAAVGMVALGPDVTEEFYRVIGDVDGRVDLATVRWHAALAAEVGDGCWSLGHPHEAAPMDVVLSQASRWLRSMGAHEEGAVRLWSHGAFDVPVLAGAYARRDWAVPWHRRNVRDLRTLYDLAGGRPEVERPAGAAHNALADAWAQMEELQACLERVGQGPPS